MAIFRVTRVIILGILAMFCAFVHMGPSLIAVHYAPNNCGRIYKRETSGQILINSYNYTRFEPSDHEYLLPCMKELYRDEYLGWHYNNSQLTPVFTNIRGICGYVTSKNPSARNNFSRGTGYYDYNKGTMKIPMVEDYTKYAMGKDLISASSLNINIFDPYRMEKARPPGTKIKSNMLAVHVIFVIVIKDIPKYLNISMKDYLDTVADSYDRLVAKIVDTDFVEITGAIEKGICKPEHGETYCGTYYTSTIIAAGYGTYVVKPMAKISKEDTNLIRNALDFRPIGNDYSRNGYKPTMMIISDAMRYVLDNRELPIYNYTHHAKNVLGREKNTSICTRYLSERGIDVCYTKPYLDGAQSRIVVVNAMDDFLDRWYSNAKYVERDEFSPELHPTPTLVHPMVKDEGFPPPTNVHVNVRKPQDEKIPLIDPLTQFLSDPHTAASIINDAELGLIYNQFNYGVLGTSITEPYMFHGLSYPSCGFAKSYRLIDSLDKLFVDIGNVELLNSSNRIYGFQNTSPNESVDSGMMSTIGRYLRMGYEYNGAAESLQRVCHVRYKLHPMFVNFFYEKECALLRTRIKDEAMDVCTYRKLHPNRNKGPDVFKDLAHNLVPVVNLSSALLYMDSDYRYNKDYATKLKREAYVADFEKSKKRGRKGWFVPGDAMPHADAMDLKTVQYVDRELTYGNPLEEYLEYLKDADSPEPVDFRSKDINWHAISWAIHLAKKDYSFYHQNVYQSKIFEIAAVHMDAIAAIASDGKHLLQSELHPYSTMHYGMSIITRYDEIWNSPSMYKVLPAEGVYSTFYQANVGVFIDANEEDTRFRITPYLWVNWEEPEGCVQPHKKGEPCKRLYSLLDNTKNSSNHKVLKDIKDLDPMEYAKLIAKGEYTLSDPWVRYSDDEIFTDMYGGHYEKIKAIAKSITFPNSKEYIQPLFVRMDEEMSAKMSYIDGGILKNRAMNVNPILMMIRPKTSDYHEEDFNSIFYKDRYWECIPAYHSSEQHHIDAHMIGAHHYLANRTSVEEAMDEFAKEHYLPHPRSVGSAYRYGDLVCNTQKDTHNDPVNIRFTAMDFINIVSRYDCCRIPDMESAERTIIKAYEGNPDNGRFFSEDYLDIDHKIAIDALEVLIIPKAAYIGKMHVSAVSPDHNYNVIVGTEADKHKSSRVSYISEILIYSTICPTLLALILMRKRVWKMFGAYKSDNNNDTDFQLPPKLLPFTYDNPTYVDRKIDTHGHYETGVSPVTYKSPINLFRGTSSQTGTSTMF